LLPDLLLIVMLISNFSKLNYMFLTHATLNPVETKKGHPFEDGPSTGTLGAGYSLSGCSPAEPDSTSPETQNYDILHRSRQTGENFQFYKCPLMGGIKKIALQMSIRPKNTTFVENLKNRFP
jgi:hypothetical protein